VEAFSSYSEEDLHKIADICTCKKYEADENIVVHGAPAETLHIIVEGHGKVSALQQVGTLKAGEVFGEDAMRLSASVNPTQVSAAGGPITTLSVSSSLFQNLDIKRPHIAKRGKGLKSKKRHSDTLEDSLEHVKRDAGQCEDSGREIIVGVKPSKEEADVIKLAVENNKILGEVLQLSEEQRVLISESVYAIRLEKDEVLFGKGSHAFAFYIIRDGMMDVLLDGKTSSGIYLQPGSSFGELALLYDSPRSATLRCSKAGTLWVLPKANFRHVASLCFKQRIKEYSDFISRIPAISSSFGSENLDMLADVIEEVTILEGESLCEEGYDNGMLFVIYQGECEMERDDQTITLTKGDWVGEEQVLKGTPAAFTVTVVSEDCTALVLDHVGLKTVTSAKNNLKSLDEAIRQDHIVKESFADQVLKDHVQESLKTLATTLSLASMVRLGVLGEGSFGSVILLKDMETSSHYALKAISKNHIKEEKMEVHLSNEKSVMSIMDSDFVVRLFGSYQDDNNIFFLLEPVTGGELFDVYSEEHFFGNQAHAKFYIACVTLALEHIHCKRVIYRDLKLENCLVDHQGYLKLTDMGIAKVVLGKTYTVCGTADYFAPETLRQTGHNRAVDWWATGVLLFIMVVGRSPFDAEDVTQIYKNIIKGFSKVKFPSSIATDLSDVIKSLCRKKPEERVPMQKGGVEALQEMPWFSSLSWKGLVDRTVEAPFIPEPMSLDKLAAKKLERDFSLEVGATRPWDGTVDDWKQ
jgi:CRP-like cAMP-binding protein